MPPRYLRGLIHAAIVAATLVSGAAGGSKSVAAGLGLMQQQQQQQQQQQRYPGSRRATRPWEEFWPGVSSGGPSLAGRGDDDGALDVMEDEDDVDEGEGPSSPREVTGWDDAIDKAVDHAIRGDDRQYAAPQSRSQAGSAMAWSAADDWDGGSGVQHHKSEVGMWWEQQLESLLDSIGDAGTAWKEGIHRKHSGEIGPDDDVGQGDSMPRSSSRKVSLPRGERSGSISPRTNGNRSPGLASSADHSAGLRASAGNGASPPRGPRWELETAVALRDKGRELMQKGDITDARDVLQAAVTMLSSIAEEDDRAQSLLAKCRLNCATCAVKEGDHVAAIELCSQVIAWGKAEGTVGRAHYTRGGVYRTLSHRCEGGTGGGFLATAREEMEKAWELLRGSDAGSQVAKAIGIIDDEIVASAVGGGGGIASPQNERGSSRMSDGENVERGWVSAGLSPLCGSTAASSRRREGDAAGGYSGRVESSRTGRDSEKSRQVEVKTARSHRGGDEAISSRSQSKGAGTRTSASPPMSSRERSAALSKEGSAASSRHSRGKRGVSQWQEGSVQGSQDRMRGAAARRWTPSPGAGHGASGSGRIKARGAVMATWLSSGSPSRGVGAVAGARGKRGQEDVEVVASAQQGGGGRESRIRKPGWASSSSVSPAARSSAGGGLTSTAPSGAMTRKGHLKKIHDLQNQVVPAAGGGGDVAKRRVSPPRNSSPLTGTAMASGELSKAYRATPPPPYSSPESGSCTSGSKGGETGKDFGCRELASDEPSYTVSVAGERRVVAIAEVGAVCGENKDRGKDSVGARRASRGVVGIGEIASKKEKEEKKDDEEGGKNWLQKVASWANREEAAPIKKPPPAWSFEAWGASPRMAWAQSPAQLSPARLSPARLSLAIPASGRGESSHGHVSSWAAGPRSSREGVAHRLAGDSEASARGGERVGGGLLSTMRPDESEGYWETPMPGGDAGGESASLFSASGHHRPHHDCKACGRALTRGPGGEVACASHSQGPSISASSGGPRRSVAVGPSRGRPEYPLLSEMAAIGMLRGSVSPPALDLVKRVAASSPLMQECANDAAAKHPVVGPSGKYADAAAEVSVGDAKDRAIGKSGGAEAGFEGGSALERGDCRPLEETVTGDKSGRSTVAVPDGSRNLKETAEFREMDDAEANSSAPAPAAATATAAPAAPAAAAAEAVEGAIGSADAAIDILPLSPPPPPSPPPAAAAPSPLPLLPLSSPTAAPSDAAKSTVSAASTQVDTERSTSSCERSGAAVSQADAECLGEVGTRASTETRRMANEVDAKSETRGEVDASAAMDARKRVVVQGGAEPEANPARADYRVGIQSSKMERSQSFVEIDEQIDEALNQLSSLASSATDHESKAGGANALSDEEVASILGPAWSSPGKTASAQGVAEIEQKQELERRKEVAGVDRDAVDTGGKPGTAGSGWWLPSSGCGVVSRAVNGGRKLLGLASHLVSAKHITRKRVLRKELRELCLCGLEERVRNAVASAQVQAGQ